MKSNRGKKKSVSHVPGLRILVSDKAIIAFIQIISALAFMHWQISQSNPFVDQEMPVKVLYNQPEQQ
jgi:hypothetical protein